MKPAQAMAYIRQVGCLGLDSRQTIPSMIGALHHVIPSRNNFFYWTNPDGSPANIYAEEILPQVFEDYAQSTRLLRSPTEPSIQALATLPAGIGRMHELFSPALIDRSVTRQIVLEPYEVSGYSIIASVRQGPAVLGMVTVGRSAGDPDFSDEDCRTLKSLTPFFRQAAAAEPVDPVAMWVDSGQGAAVVADGDGRIMHMSQAALALLTYFRHASLPPDVSLKPIGPHLPDPLRKLCRDLLTIGRGGRAPPPTLDLSGSWGRYRVRAYPLAGSLPARPAELTDPIAIFIQQQKPLPLHIAERLQNLPLSARQREIALQLGLGRAPAEIEEELGITRNTYRDHVSAIYERLEINSRAELLASLMAGDTPRILN